MIGKILLTALVIAGAVMALRLRNNGAAPGLSPDLVGAPAADGSRRQAMKFAALGVVGLMLIGAGFFIYNQWQAHYRVVTVHVIDSRTGKAVTYEAYQGDVETRGFMTLDGRRISLAEVERMEVAGEKN